MASEQSDEVNILLRVIANEIPIHHNLNLGLQLGLSLAEVNNFLRTNNRYHEITSDGTVGMLRHWSETVSPSSLRSKLREALMRAGLVRIAQRHLPLDPVGVLSAPPEIIARGPRAHRAYVEAARNGTIKVYRTRLMLVGQERVGKTSLKKSLTGQRFDVHEPITDGIEATTGREIIIQLVKADGKWSNHQKRGKTENTYEKALVSDVAKRLKSSEEKDQSEDQGQDTEEKSYVGSSASSDISTPLNEKSMPPHIMSQVVGELKKDETEGASSPDSPSDGEITFDIWDFAGHDVYYTTHQVFLSWRAVYIVVFDLSRDLDSSVPPESQDEFYEMTKKNSKSELTCLEFITFWLNSIYFNAVPPQSNTHEDHISSPPIFIVGTHRQSITGDIKETDKIRQKVDAAFDKIKEAIDQKPYWGQVEPRFYAVENSIGETDDEITALRKHIERVARKEPYMGEDMPIKYLLFEQEVKKKVEAEETNSMSLKEVREMVRPFDIHNDEELFTMLHFYHDLGFIVYFGEMETVEQEESHLRDIVILNPQWLIDVFKKVITVLKPEERTRRDLNPAWTKLEKKGLLQDSLIRYMWQSFSEKKCGLIELMAKFDLICEAPPQIPESFGSDDATKDSDEGPQYYVPSRLKPTCTREDMKHIVKEASLEFYVDFKGFITDGLFHRLMARTVREGKQPVRLTYRLIRYHPDEEHQAFIEMLPLHEAAIKVTVYRPPVYHVGHDKDGSHTPCLPNPEIMRLVMTFLEDTLTSLLDCRQISGRIQYDMCFACPKCGQKKTFKEGKGKEKLMCCEFTFSMASVNSSYGIEPVENVSSKGREANAGRIMAAEQSDSDRVTTAHMRKLVPLVHPDEYEDLCYALGFQFSEAKQKLAEYGKNYRQALSDVFRSWVNEKDRSKADLRNALEETKLGGLYSRVCGDD